MRAVVTRVKEASVTIEGTVRGQIGDGYLVLLGVGPEDTEETAVKLADKICNLRIFEDFPPSGVLQGGETGFGCPAVREIYGPLPGTGLYRSARGVRGQDGRGVCESRPGDHSF